MSKRFCFSLTVYLFLSGLLLWSAPNLVSNADFSQSGAKGLPARWRLSKPDAGHRLSQPGGKFSLELKGSPSPLDSYWIQHGLKLKAGTLHHLKAKYRCAAGTSVMIYVERSRPSWKTFSSKWQKGTGTWQDLEFTFSHNGDENYPFYLVLRKKGKSAAQFSQLSLTAEAEKFSNGDFSEGLHGWSGDGKLSASGGFHGQTLELLSREPSVNPKAYHAAGTVSRGKTYILSYEVKGSEDRRLTDSMNATWFKVYPVINGKTVSGTDDWRDCFSSWQKKTVIFTPENDGDMKIFCELKSPGQVYFDNLTLEESNTRIPPLTILFNPPFTYGEGLYSTASQAAALTGCIEIGCPEIKKIRLKFGQTDTEYAIHSSLLEFALPLPAQPRTCPLQVTAFSAAGKMLAQAEKLFRVHPPKLREITFRSDATMLINGRPFFPLGVWGARGSGSLEEKAKLLARTGFNVWKTNAEHLDIAAKNGMFCLANIIEKLPQAKTPAEKIRQKEWKKLYAESLREKLSHPALIGYCTSDEPAWRGVSSELLQESYSFIKAIDPYRPILVNEAPRGKINELKKYADAFDVYGVDIYPIPVPGNHSNLKDRTMTCIGKYTDICHQVVENRKPVWMTLQGFAWGAITGKPKVYPTHAENRFMAYNAILHNARGLLWWGINSGGDNPEFLATLGKTVQEIKALIPVLVTFPIPCTIQSDSKALRMMRRQLNGCQYYFVINESGQKVRAAFTGAFPAALHVLFENRSVRTTGSSFSDDFAPYDVHVYAERPELPPPMIYSELLGNWETAPRFGNVCRNSQWIWYPGKNKIGGHQAWFRRELNIATLQKAELFITADDYYQVYINDRLAGDQPGLDRNWTTIDHYDITGSLQQGKNILKIRAADSGNPPCGLLCTVRLTDKAGKVTLIHSDGEFLSSENGSADWKPSQVLAPYGKGPWGNGMSIRHNDNKMLGKLNF